MLRICPTETPFDIDSTDADSDSAGGDAEANGSADSESDGDGDSAPPESTTLPPIDVGEPVLGSAPSDRGWAFLASPDQTPSELPAGTSGTTVDLRPGEDVDAAVAQAAPGTTFRFYPGVYQGVAMEPKDGDAFLGFGQATLDGSGTEDGTAAFTGAADGVLISGFEVRNYPNVQQNGAINAQAGGSDNPPEEQRSNRWIMEDLYVHANNGVGINVGPNGIVRRTRIVANGQLGITSHGGENIAVSDCEISENNTNKIDPGWEGGGSKFKFTTGLVVRNCWFHDNYGYGLWTDIDNDDVLFEDNLIENETWSCISHEISFSAVIRNNVLRNCGTDGDPWLWKAGIQIANSPNVLVENNVISNSFNGVGLIAQDRGQDRWKLENVTVRNNTITDSGQSGAVTDVTDSNGNDWPIEATVVFENNRWDAGLPSFEADLDLTEATRNSRGDADFRWGKLQLDWNQWRELGNDTNGEFQPR